eukprot:1613269-Prymnesium_polylepis.1
MLTKRATTTRAWAASSRMKSTHPVSVSLRHISSGSHQKHGNAHRPHSKHYQRHVAGHIVFGCIACEHRIRVEVPPSGPVAVLEGLTDKRLEDPCGRARNNQEGECQSKRKHAAQPTDDHCTDANRRVDGRIFVGAASPYGLSKNTECSTHQDEHNWPGRAHP